MQESRLTAGGRGWDLPGGPPPPAPDTWCAHLAVRLLQDGDPPRLGGRPESSDFFPPPSPQLRTGVLPRGHPGRVSGAHGALWGGGVGRPNGPPVAPSATDKAKRAPGALAGRAGQEGLEAQGAPLPAAPLPSPSSRP